jgi:hypothetical protein
MTPVDKARFIGLWQQGLETAAIAERLDINATTAQSRAHWLQQHGLIEPRPRGELPHAATTGRTRRGLA